MSIPYCKKRKKVVEINGNTPPTHSRPITFFYTEHIISWVQSPKSRIQSPVQRPVLPFSLWRTLHSNYRLHYCRHAITLAQSPECRQLPVSASFWINHEQLYESVINLSFSASNTGPKRAHERALDEECTRYRGEAFADTTRTTYKSQFRTYLRFCLYFGYDIVPCSTLTLLRYVAFLSRTLSPGSISNYFNIVRLIHQQMDILSSRKRVS